VAASVRKNTSCERPPEHSFVSNCPSVGNQQDPDRLPRFKQEAQAAAALKRNSGGRSPRPNDTAPSENAESIRIRHTQLKAKHTAAVSQRALAYAFAFRLSTRPGEIHCSTFCLFPRFPRPVSMLAWLVRGRTFVHPIRWIHKPDLRLSYPMAPSPSWPSNDFTLRQISSRIVRTSSMGRPFGSRSGQSSRRRPGT
jgi:hypothetical protein